jgi:predicted GH43/DUF377 family glycosyl hydrolase
MSHPFFDHYKQRSGRDIIHRWEGNPIISTDDIPFSCLNIYNAAVAKWNGNYILLIRVEDMQGHSVFVRAQSKDGVHFDIDAKPIMEPALEGPFSLFEKNGIEDPRITIIQGMAYIVYTAHSEHGTRLAIAQTQDFKSIERIALISEPDNKSGVLFPQKISGRYVRLDRPQEDGNIWVSYSDDLIYWGEACVVISRRGGYWDSARVGAAAPPIEINEGWLLIYYGVRATAAGPLYRLSAAILDRDVPSRIIGRSDIPILSPREYYERVGDWGNVVFSCGAIVEEAHGEDELKLYYGASTTSICLGTARLQEVIDHCLQGG